ncbi:hypothetical protein D3C78_1291590 [compost metagenome]
MGTIHCMRKKLLCAVTVSAALALTACGGGNDDDTAPSGDVGILFISNATNPSLNGWYGSGNVGLTGIDDTGTIGPNECAFDFDNFTKLEGDRTLAMMGDIRYAYPGNSTPPLNGDNIKIKDTTYAFVKEGTNLDHARVNLTTGTITFDKLLARDAGNNSVELSGAIKLPDEASRDAVCRKPVS